MTKSNISRNADVATHAPPPTKHQQVVDLLNRDAGASLEELSNLAHWLPHSTRAFLTGLKKKGYTIASDKTDGVRRYRATKTPVEGAAK